MCNYFRHKESFDNLKGLKILKNARFLAKFGSKSAAYSWKTALVTKPQKIRETFLAWANTIDIKLD